MIKRHVLRRALFSILPAAILLAGSFSPTARAMFSIDFYQSNDILYYIPGDAPKCSTGSGAAAGAVGGTGNKDYKGRQIISDAYLDKIKQYQPIYEKAAAETKVPWQIFAVIHIRETQLNKINPANGQGIYQDFEGGGAPPGATKTPDGKGVYPAGPVDDEEFLRQTIYAAKIIKQKSGDKFDLLQKGDADAIKDMFFGYNGRAPVYTKQARDLGFNNDYEGSPYVMNIADEKRDPEVQKDNGTWGQIKADGGEIQYPANGDYGAYVMYAALAGMPAATSNIMSNIGCAIANFGAAAGKWALDKMQVYYQIREPWASSKYGPHDISGWGCGPTTTAMVIASLNNDPSINPGNMAELFVQNGYLVESGTSWSAWQDGKLAQKYGLQITELGTDMSKAAEALQRGSFVIMSANGTPLTCADCGHILAFRGITASGNFLFADPANPERTSDENGMQITSAGAVGIRNMWEVRK